MLSVRVSLRCFADSVFQHLSSVRFHDVVAPSLRWVARAAVPALIGTMGDSDSPPAIPLRFGCPSARQYRRASRRRRRRWGLLRSWGDLWTHATFSDSGGTLAPSHEDDSGAGSCCLPALPGASVLTIIAVSPPRGAPVLPTLVEQRRLPTTISLSKLNHVAHALAVYASQLSFPLSRSYGHARLASGWWPAFTGRGSQPRKVPNEVSASSTWLPPHPSFATQSTAELGGNSSHI